ncbi:MAG: hypothetical protein KF699_16825 [Phycisphaeraceae bacterium]|nr:hypothetical protein [Phycisphaeraceae bacterium]
MKGTEAGLPPDLAAVAGYDQTLVRAKQVNRLLVAEARAARLNRELNPALAAQLHELRSHPAAVAVRERLSGSLADIEQAFEELW